MALPSLRIIKIYRVLKQFCLCKPSLFCLRIIKIYRVLKHTTLEQDLYRSLRIIKIYRVLKPQILFEIISELLLTGNQL